MRTVVALYDRFDEAQQAVQALVDANFHREDVTMVSRDATGEYSRYLNRNQEEHADRPSTGAAAGAGVGAALGTIGGLLLGLGALAIPGIGPVIAAGPIVGALTGAGVGAVAGGLLGGLLDMGIPEEHANFYSEGVRRGGTLVVARTSDEEAERARQVLNRFNPVDLETRVSAWRNTGWKRFDPNAEPLSQDQLEFNRFSEKPRTGGEDSSTDTRSGWSTAGMSEHLTEDIYSSDRVDETDSDVPVTGRAAETADIHRADVSDWSEFDTRFHQDFLTRYGNSGYQYDYYQPAYRYGYDLALDPRYHDFDWNQVEMDARDEYERRGLRGAWDDVKDAVRYAWESVTGR